MSYKHNLLLTLLWVASSALAEPPSEKAPVPPKKTDAQSEAEFSGGLWPTPKLTRLMLVRWADQLSFKYELDDKQNEAFRKAIVDRWAPFIADNRAKLEPVFNEFVEMRLELQRPTKEQLQSWANKALPALQLVNEQIGKAKTDLRKILTPEQRLEFEVQALEFGMGLKVAEARIRQLQSGEFDPENIREFWQPTAAERNRIREAKETANTGPRAEKFSAVEPNPDDEAQKEKTPTDPILAELDAWEKYVAEFGSLYQFNEGQRTTAASLLAEFKNRAITHRQRKHEEIEQLEARIANADGSEEEMKELEEQLTILYGPIDEMFAQLKGRVQLIPTGEQCAAVEKQKQAKESALNDEKAEENPESDSEQKP